MPPSSSASSKLRENAQPLNVIIPLGGLGTRFAKEGYAQPKCFVPVLGKAILFWVMENLSLDDGDLLVIPYNPALTKVQFESRVLRAFPALAGRVTFVTLPASTKGAAETLIYALDALPESRRSLRTVSVDSDTFYRADVLEIVRALPAGVHATVSFETQTLEPIYSYVQVDPAGEGSGAVAPVRGRTAMRVTQVAEKVRISTLANTGCYVFSDADAMRALCEATVERHAVDDAIKEPYTSVALQIALERKDEVLTVPVGIDEFVVLGTPIQVQLFASSQTFFADPESTGGEGQGKGADEKEKRSESGAGDGAAQEVSGACPAHSTSRDPEPLSRSLAPKRICFDLDNTLVSYPQIEGDYTTVQPIASNIKYAQFLKESGHTIIIFTARGMKSRRANLGRIQMEVVPTIHETLRRFKIPCDELHIGKPYADFYIDDLAINPHVQSVQKETGFYHVHTAQRSFNSLALKHVQLVEKTSRAGKVIDGEIFWYENMPPAVAYMFPRYYGRIENGYRMEFIGGLPLSFLNVSGMITPQLLGRVMQQFKVLHGVAVPREVEGRDRPRMYDSHHAKIKRRLEENRGMYESLCEDAGWGSAAWLDEVCAEVGEYCERDLGRFGVIHGDPVLSNIIQRDDIDSALAFFDMRGVLGEAHLSICGDINYDYAKVLQSLIGYDAILYHKPYVNNPVVLDAFWAGYAEATGGSADGPEGRWLKVLTCGLLVSLIPLHEPDNRLAFAALAREFWLGIREAGDQPSRS